jgi:serine/threonine-protein kinase HipA
MDKEVFVYVDLDGQPRLVGRLWARLRKESKAPPSNTNAPGSKTRRFSLEPALKLGPGPFHTPADTPMFGAIGDSAQ